MKSRTISPPQRIVRDAYVRATGSFTYRSGEVRRARHTEAAAQKYAPTATTSTIRMIVSVDRSE
jgi:hypothetical protein